jgi:hypothetical protein
MKPVVWAFAVTLLALQACGGGGADGGGEAPGGGAGGGGGGVSMNGWVHVPHDHWNYWKPTDQWIGTESASGIDISSPTGDADVSFAFVYGPLVPTTVEQAEAAVEQIFTNFTVVNQSAVVAGPYGGASRTTEFAAVWKATQASVHGRFTVNLGNQTFDVHLTMANTALWPALRPTLQLIADHITYCPGGNCGP